MRIETSSGRYADDFKIVCRTRKNAEKWFYAVRKWLKERLSDDGYAVVCADGLLGVIDEMGNYIIEPSFIGISQYG